MTWVDFGPGVLPSSLHRGSSLPLDMEAALEAAFYGTPHRGVQQIVEVIRQPVLGEPQDNRIRQVVASAG